MKWYTGSIDNFFDDPYKILEFSKKLDFKKDEKNEWPGTRTKTTYDINKDFSDIKSFHSGHNEGNARFSLGKLKLKNIEYVIKKLRTLKNSYKYDYVGL